MSRNRGKRLPHMNNSGPHREPTNVWIAMPTEKDPRQMMVVQSNFYENELQQLAFDFPTYIIFVTNGGLGER